MIQIFKDISIKLENNILKIDLKENPIIEDIQITGIKSNQTTEKILEAINLKNRKSFVENILEKDVTLIKNILKLMVTILLK